jgi:hypothetical protein
MEALPIRIRQILAVAKNIQIKGLRETIIENYGNCAPEQKELWAKHSETILNNDLYCKYLGITDTRFDIKEPTVEGRYRIEYASFRLAQAGIIEL